MESTLQIRVTSLLVTALALLALLTAYLLGGGGGTTVLPAQAAPEQSAAPGKPRMVRMVGSGTATVVPDQLGFTLSVTDKQPELDRALANSSATMKRVLAALEEYGVRAADVQTTGLQMYPEYDYQAYGPPVLTGYRVTQRAQVRVRELAQGGRAVTAAVEAGGNGVRVTDIRLGVADPEAALDRARDAAVAEATRKAEQYAAATGQALGDVLALREVGDADRARRHVELGYLPAQAALDSRALPIRAGKDELAVKVQVVWAFAEPDAE